MPESSSSTFPWQQLMGIGLGQLRIPADRFWALTPKELRAIIVGTMGMTQDAPMPRDLLNSLIKKFPD